MRKSCIRHAFCTAVILALLPVTGAPDAEAQNYIINYGKKLANGKTCRVVLGENHFHAANEADASKARAQAGAIEDWASFVVFEYGKRWSRWSAANKRSMTCMHDKDAGVWRCRAEAQPCL